jgi:hypothetical protein
MRPAPTPCKLMVSGSISPPSTGYFSPFPHGTGSLSVMSRYLALADSPAIFPPSYRARWYSGVNTKSEKLFSLTGLLPSMAVLSRNIQLTIFTFKLSPETGSIYPTTPFVQAQKVWAVPLSFATTKGITIVLFSSAY